MKKIILSLILSTILIGVVSFNFNQKDNITESSVDNPIIETVTSIENKEIFGTMDTNFSWAKEPTPQNLISDSSAIVKIKILSIGDSEFMDSLNYDRPLTPVNVQILNVISGDKLSDTLNIYTLGGDVKVSELIKHKPKEVIDKMQLN
ncbi:MAG: hypothetical protein ACRDA5_00500, partial [Clostridium sp.]